MAEEERFVVSRQDIEEFVKWMNVVSRSVIGAKVDLEYFRPPWLGELLLRIPELLPDIDPTARAELSRMVRTVYSDLDKQRGTIDVSLRMAECFLLEAYGKLGRMLWGEAACKAGEYPDWWRDLLLGDLGDS